LSGRTTLSKLDRVLLVNGVIHTLDARGTVADALLVQGGRVAFVGRRADVNPPAGAPVLDLGGRTVTPGLVDAHGHLSYLALGSFTLDLTGRRSEEEGAALVAEAAAGRPAGEWILGRGWDQNLWPGGRFPSRASLDRAAPRHPVALSRIDGHAAWVNGAALAAAGVDRATADPYGGLVVRDARGEPTGLLVDTAERLVHRVVPPPSEGAFDRAVEAAIARCLAAGLTGVHEMGADHHALAAYRRLVERGRFPFRNYVAVAGASEATWAEWRERGPARIGDGQGVVGALKLLADGALGSRGAALCAPYADEPGTAGLLLYPPEELRRLTGEGLARGFQVCVHAIGDRANALVLDTYEAALAAVPWPAGVDPRDHRCRVEHAQVLRPEDVPRFARLGVLPSMQPAHCTSDMDWAPARLGPERVGGAYAWRSLLATGTIIAGGSDFPVEDVSPFHGIHAAVTRRPRGGDDPGWQPGQRMTRPEAVRAFTAWNAVASRQEAELGTLEPGKRADLVALSEDVFTCPDDRLAAIVPALTMVGGRIVFERPAP